jgi:hypothetical protein
MNSFFKYSEGRLPLRDPRVNDVADSAVRLDEYEFHQFPAVEAWRAPRAAGSC